MTDTLKLEGVGLDVRDGSSLLLLFFDYVSCNLFNRF